MYYHCFFCLACVFCEMYVRIKLNIRSLAIQLNEKYFGKRDSGNDVIVTLLRVYFNFRALRPSGIRFFSSVTEFLQPVKKVYRSIKVTTIEFVLNRRIQLYEKYKWTFVTSTCSNAIDKESITSCTFT